ncbi:hypothetical protein GOBAR_DD36612 [Gossypium barbadense]|nr:hypothetical protein GOBAR_DD36612 [Gossypium barbadense]
MHVSSSTLSPRCFTPNLTFSSPRASTMLIPLAWAHVQSLKSCLDEHNLELRVKTANEAEAISQQKLAAAEAEIAELRHKLEASKRDKSRLTDSLKAKIEENEAYLSEIEALRFLNSLTPPNISRMRLVLEGLRAKQLQDTLLLEKHNMEKEIQQANTSLDFYNMKAARIEDQLRFCSDQVQKLGEERFQKSVSLENTQKRLSDMRRSSHQAKESLEDSQFKIERSRAALLELQIEIERERFKKKRIEEELEVARRKVVLLQAKTEGNSMIERLQEELREYREILKCSICLDRPKEIIPFFRLLLQNATISSATLVCTKSPKIVTASVRFVLQALVPMMLNLFISDLGALIRTALERCCWFMECHRFCKTLRSVEVLKCLRNRPLPPTTSTHSPLLCCSSLSLTAQTYNLVNAPLLCSASLSLSQPNSLDSTQSGSEVPQKGQSTTAGRYDEERVLISEVLVSNKDGEELEWKDLEMEALTALKACPANSALTVREVQEDVHRIIDSGYFSSCMPVAVDTRDGIRLVFQLDELLVNYGHKRPSLFLLLVSSCAGKVVNLKRLDEVINSINGWYMECGLFGLVSGVDIFSGGTIRLQVAEAEVNNISIRFLDRKT